MKPNVTALERAFELARSGKFATSNDIRRCLSAEGYSHYQINGPSLLKQIRAVIETARDMPKGPKGQKHPADAVSNAIKIAKIATGEKEEEMPDDGKDPAAKSLGSRGGKARAAALSKKERAEIAKRAAAARWKRSASK